MRIVKPPRLRPGATIGIISPASPQRDEARLERGIQYLEKQGFRVELGKNTSARFGGYLAGTDAERCDDLEAMFVNRNIEAVFCARGGYGTPRLLNMVNYRKIARNPKIFVGFSDTTALQSAIFRRTGLITFSGAMASVDMADIFDTESEDLFWQILTEPVETRRISQSLTIEQLYGGVADGRLYCGNLTLLAGLLGTPFAPFWKGGILLVEDIGEAPYRIDRNLMHLENAGLWKKLVGLCFGQFTQTETGQSPMPQRTMQEITAEFATRAELPSLGNIMYGHTAKKLTLPFGIKTHIDADRTQLTMLESPILPD